MAPRQKKAVNALGIEPRDLTPEQRRALLQAKKKEYSKDWHVLTEETKSDIIPYNFLVLDHILQLNGMPGRGHIIQIHGDEGSAKSSLGYCISREYQRQTQEPVAIFDFERTATNEYFNALGLDHDLLFCEFPDSVEEATKKAVDLMNNGVRFFMWDSIPRMKSMVDLEDIMNKKAYNAEVGTHARVMQRFYDIMLPYIAKADGRMLMINQTRSRIEMTQEAQSAAKGYATVTNLNYSLPGGRANKYAVGTMIEISKDKAVRAGGWKDDEWILEATPRPGEEYAALRLKVRCLKAKSSGNGYHQGYMWYRSHMGIDESISIREAARALKLIHNHGKKWVVGESVDNAIKVYEDKAAALQGLVENPDYSVLASLRNLVIEKLKSVKLDTSFQMTDEDIRSLSGEVEPSAANGMKVELIEDMDDDI